MASKDNNVSILHMYRGIRDTYNEEKKRRDLLLVRYLYRPVSFFLTIPFLRLGMSANQGTLMNFLLLLVAMFLLVVGVDTLTLIGAVIYLLLFITDCIDGNIARYKQQRSYFGKVADGLVDTLVYYIFISIALGNIASGSNKFSPVVELLLGCSVTLSMLTLSYFRARVIYALGEIATLKSNRASESSRQDDSPPERKGVIYNIFFLYQNVGPFLPILFLAALRFDQVSIFLFVTAVVYVCFSSAEIIYSLVSLQSRLSVKRDTK